MYGLRLLKREAVRNMSYKFFLSLSGWKNVRHNVHCKFLHLQIFTFFWVVVTKNFYRTALNWFKEIVRLRVMFKGSVSKKQFLTVINIYFSTTNKAM